MQVFNCATENCNYLKSAHKIFEAMDANYRCLESLNVWLSCSNNDTLSKHIRSLYECTLKKLGINIIKCDVEGILEKNISYDALIMFTLTTGTSARAIELVVSSKYNKHNSKDVEIEKLYVYMKNEFKDKYVDCTLNKIIREKLTDSIKMANVNHYEEKDLLEENVFKNIIYKLMNIAKDKATEMKIKETEIIPEILIVTALPLEYKAMKALVNNPRYDDSLGDNKKQYTYGQIGERNIIVAMAGMGNNFSSAIATKMLDKYSTIKYTIMTGIAGGVPYIDNAKDHVRLGDIVISGDNGIIQHDKGKDTEEYKFKLFGLKFIKKDSFQYDFHPRPPESTLLRNAKIYVEEIGVGNYKFWDELDALNIERPKNMMFSKNDWLNFKKEYNHPIPDGYNENRPRIHIGTIASGNTVVKNEKVRNKLKNNFQIKAIEMEASGVADATWLHGKDYFVIRGICDYSNSDKNKIWQPYAAAVAAGFTKELIENL